MSSKQARQGFSLVELMVVIAIIALLAAVALPAYRDYTLRAKFSDATNIIKTVNDKAKEYYALHGLWPIDLVDLGYSNNDASALSNYFIDDVFSFSSDDSDCNWFYTEFYLNPDAFPSGTVEEGDYLEFEIGKNIDEDEINVSCGYVGALDDKGYVKCTYADYGELEEASGGNTCP